MKSWRRRRISFRARTRRSNARTAKSNRPSSTLQEKAEQLALTSKYKSEFLANMSHELRTPLNSLLILAEMLADNAEGNLTPKQREFAQTIYSSGSDLLSLINDILDLSKIESGTMAVEVSEVPFGELREYVDRTFRPLAENKKLDFKVELVNDLPPAIFTDSKRLQQVLRNLLSNAFKFTEEGSVGLRIASVESGWSTDNEVLNDAEAVIGLSIHDTGIGVPADKLKIIFEPFQQADMGTSRHFGGTGLGLSISREIARLLGGEIGVVSTPGQGSTFTLYLPLHLAPRPEPAPRGHGDSRIAPSLTGMPRIEVRGDRDTIRAGDQVVLIVEHDAAFADILLETAHEKGLKALITAHGETALELAQTVKPSAITLDLRLPDMHGWVVLERLKHHPATRHIPVHIISVDDSTDTGQQRGAVTCLRKPVTRKTLDQAFAQMKSLLPSAERNLLVVEDNAVERGHIERLIGNGHVHCTGVGTAAELLAALEAHHYDCLVLDLRLPDLPGIDLLAKIRRELGLRELPVIVYTGKDLTEEETARLKEMSESIISKDGHSLDELAEQAGRFLQQVGEPSVALPAPWLPDAEPALVDKRILLVDDDPRNLFALTSMLEHWQMQVRRAENGREALQVLQANPDMDAVLMDIMMPGLDGYDTMQTIRRDPRFADLPIIALTAKAMKDDREKCLQAGASDYIAKPVNSEQLLAILRVLVGASVAVGGERLAGAVTFAGFLEAGLQEAGYSFQIVRYCSKPITACGEASYARPQVSLLMPPPREPRTWRNYPP